MVLEEQGNQVIHFMEQGIMLEYLMEQGSSLLQMGTFWEDFKKQFIHRGKGSKGETYISPGWPRA